MTRLTAALLCLFLALSAPQAAARLVSAPGVPGVTGGLVTTSEPHAARAGARILAEGGNAIDAAAAVALALSVVEPQSSGIGGGGFIVIHLADEGQTVTVDARETAPMAASVDQFLPYTDGRARVDGFEGASTSGLAVGVPGLVRGLELALERWGRLTFADVTGPAIALAAEGFHVGPRLASSIRHSRLGNEPGNPAYDQARKVFRPEGRALDENDHLRQPELARTLRLIARHGADAFYRGEIAEAIVRTQRHARGDDPHGRGRMTTRDLSSYRALARPPVSGEYRGFRLMGMGPPSSGGLTVLYQLGLLERFPLGDRDAGYGPGAARTMHVMLEAMRLAFADRAMWMGDADHVDVPVAGLLHADYLTRRSALIDADARLAAVPADDPRTFDPAFASDPVMVDGGAFGIEGPETSHFTVIDDAGNVVSFTSSIESAWGSGLMVPGYGFLLNNQLTDFNFVPARSTAGGRHNPGANDVAPGKRPRSSMSPVILLRDDRPVAAWGSPGGATIINTVVGMAVNLVDHRMGIQQAADAPRFSQVSPAGRVFRERGIPAATIEALRRLGHEFAEPRDIGAVQGIALDPGTGLRFGAADRRRDGATAIPEHEPIGTD